MTGPNGQIAIAGGGVIGLAVAHRLAKAGMTVDVFEAQTMGRGASWAAGGMLASGIEHESADPSFYELAKASLDAWPSFADGLKDETGIDVHLHRNGILVAVYDEDDAGYWRGVWQKRCAAGVPLTWLDPAAARDLEPDLAPGLLGAVFSPEDGRADNRQLSDALRHACRASGVRLHENAPVNEIVIESGRVRGLKVKGTFFAADAVLLAAGAWCGTFSGLPPEVVPPVRPQKGQMMALKAPSGMHPPRHVVWGPGIYCVPRDGGRLFLGATSEEAGFDDTLTAGGLGGLLSAALRIFPKIRGFAFEDAWAGFRPATPDSLPFLGRTSIEGLFTATGHHRNGILLTPITAEIMSDLILGSSVRGSLALDAFSPARFNHLGETVSSGLLHPGP